MYIHVMRVCVCVCACVCVSLSLAVIVHVRRPDCLCLYKYIHTGIYIAGIYGNSYIQIYT